MTHTALSDCSYPESTVYNIRDEIDATTARLKVVIGEEATLRKELGALFAKRREEAIEQVRLANLHLDLVNEEEAAFCDDLSRAAASSKEVCHLIQPAISHAYYGPTNTTGIARLWEP
jgi:endonuclease/exonuclease/phosphatase family metal-dependent hydrolase